MYGGTWEMGCSRYFSIKSSSIHKDFRVESICIIWGDFMTWTLNESNQLPSPKKKITSPMSRGYSFFKSLPKSFLQNTAFGSCLETLNCIRKQILMCLGPDKQWGIFPQIGNVCKHLLEIPSLPHLRMEWVHCQLGTNDNCVSFSMEYHCHGKQKGKEKDL